MTTDITSRLRIHGNMGDKWSMMLSHEAANEIESLRQQLDGFKRDWIREVELHGKTAVEAESMRQQLDTAWAQAHRLALELECLLMDTKDNAIVSKWWDSAHEAMDEYHKLKPGAAEDAEAWASIRKAVI